MTAPLAPLWRTALRIRAVESTLLELFARGAIAGTVHTCLGQELIPAALAPHLRIERDAFFGSHRNHGFYLALGGPLDAFLAELAGREGALCGGRGGSQHLHHERFFSSGVQGAGALHATGFAWACRRRGEGALAVAQLGDGTLGEGAVYEALTFAALLRAPVLFLLEHNGVAQSTDTATTLRGDLVARCRGFGVEADRRSDADPEALAAHLGEVVALVREGRPFVQIVDTRRLGPHSKGDDDRSAEELARLRAADPLTRLLEASAEARAVLDEERRAVAALARAVEQRPPVRRAPPAPAAAPPPADLRLHADEPVPGEAPPGRINEELGQALGAALAGPGDVILLGEDLADPYGGAFKVTRGLSTRHPDRVFSTPISEGGLTGCAVGLALAGVTAVTEIMFADFATLAADQLINHAAKLRGTYGVSCPLTVRLVSGGGRGYGPTHSQSLELLFCGVPGLRVLALSRRHRPGALVAAALAGPDPTVLVEHKALYPERPATAPPVDLRPAPAGRGDGAALPPLRYVPRDGGAPDATLVTYGAGTRWAEPAMATLITEDELRFDYFVLTQLWPLDVAAIVASARRTGRLVVVEENHPAYGVGAAVVAAVAGRLAGGLRCATVGAQPAPIPSARHLEDETLPGARRVVDAVRALARPPEEPR